MPNINQPVWCFGTSSSLFSVRAGVTENLSSPGTILRLLLSEWIRPRCSFVKDGATVDNIQILYSTGDFYFRSHWFEKFSRRVSETPGWGHSLWLTKPPPPPRVRDAGQAMNLVGHRWSPQRDEYKRGFMGLITWGRHIFVLMLKNILSC
jgi:hypothetical protein